jgi:photosystem II stability/assembly factor-like uncharacterized protein
MTSRTFALAAGSLMCVGSANAQWTLQRSNTEAEFRGLFVVSPTIVWASGTGGRIARTTDGGETWRIDSIPGADSLDLRDIDARSAKEAVAMSAGEAERGLAKMFRTTDGRSWKTVFETTEKGVFLDALSFWDALHGIAMGDPIDGRLFILVTDDGGASWKRVPMEDAPPMTRAEAAFAASGTCLAIQGTSNVWIGTGGGARARVFRSTDRGRTWKVVDTPLHAANPASGIFSIAFTDAMHGIAVGGEYTSPRAPFDNVALSSDGGKTWRLASGELPRGYMSGVAYIPGTHGRSLVAVGLAGTATSVDGGESWSMVDTLGFNSVAFASPAAGWAVGPRGRIAKWTAVKPPDQP